MPAVFQFFGENVAALGRTQQERRAAALHFPAERVREVFAVVSLGHEVGTDAAGASVSAVALPMQANFTRTARAGRVLRETVRVPQPVRLPAR